MSETLKGQCHCGEIEFTVELENGIEGIRRCNCSLCKRKGAVMATVPVGKLHVTKGAGTIRLYQWNSKQAEHYFCGTCGIYTHHKRRSNPNEYGFNVACVGIDPYSLGKIPVGDGASQSLIESDQSSK